MLPDAFASLLFNNTNEFDKAILGGFPGLYENIARQIAIRDVDEQALIHIDRLFNQLLSRKIGFGKKPRMKGDELVCKSLVESRIVVV
jgi:hypothetical protein